MYRFLVICYLLVFISVETIATSLQNNDSKIKPTKEQNLSNDTLIQEHKSFIDKGSKDLPIAPEIKPAKNIALPVPPPPEDDKAPVMSATVEKPKTKTELPKPQDTAILPTIPESKEPTNSPKQDNIIPITSEKKHDDNISIPTIPAKTPSNSQHNTETQPSMQSSHVHTLPPAPNSPEAIAARDDAILKRNQKLREKIFEQPKIKTPNTSNSINHPPKTLITDNNQPKEPILDPLQIRFIKDELSLLKFEDDDITLGALTSKARIEQMDGKKYLKLYSQAIEREQNKEKAKNNIWFISSHSKTELVMLPKKYLFRTAIRDIEKSNLTDLRILAENYPILDLIDKNGNNLLHIAIFNNNPAIAKWLIMKNVNTNIANRNALTALDLAENLQYWEIFNLLEEAGAK